MFNNNSEETCETSRQTGNNKQARWWTVDIKAAINEKKECWKKTQFEKQGRMEFGEVWRENGTF